MRFTKYVASNISNTVTLRVKLQRNSMDPTSEAQVEEILAAVRINLRNASQTWGEQSLQYQAVRRVESELLVEKSRAWGLSTEELGEILGGLNLSEK